MSDPSPAELEARRRALLDSARAEQPDPAAASQSLNELVEGRVALRTDVRGPSLRAPLRRWWVWGLGVVLTALVWLLMQRNEAPLSRALPPVPLPTATPTPGPTLPPPVVEVSPTQEPVLDAGVVPPVPIVKPVKSKEDDTDLLAQEVALIDRARVEVRATPELALVTITRHKARFPRGALRTEAELLEIEALLKLGRRPLAERRAKQLEARETEGLVAERVRRLFEQFGGAPP